MEVGQTLPFLFLMSFDGFHISMIFNIRTQILKCIIFTDFNDFLILLIFNIRTQILKFHFHHF